MKIKKNKKIDVDYSKWQPKSVEYFESIEDVHDAIKAISEDITISEEKLRHIDGDEAVVLTAKLNELRSKKDSWEAIARGYDEKGYTSIEKIRTELIKNISPIPLETPQKRMLFQLIEGYLATYKEKHPYVTNEEREMIITCLKNNLGGFASHNANHLVSFPKTKMIEEIRKNITQGKQNIIFQEDKFGFINAWVNFWEAELEHQQNMGETKTKMRLATPINWTQDYTELRSLFEILQDRGYISPEHDRYIQALLREHFTVKGKPIKENSSYVSESRLKRAIKDKNSKATKTQESMAKLCESAFSQAGKISSRNKAKPPK